MSSITEQERLKMFEEALAAVRDMEEEMFELWNMTPEEEEEFNREWDEAWGIDSES